LIMILLVWNMSLTSITVTPGDLRENSFLTRKIIHWEDITEFSRQRKVECGEGGDCTVSWDYKLRSNSKTMYLVNSQVSGSSELCGWIFNYAKRAQFFTIDKAPFRRQRTEDWLYGDFAYDTGRYQTRAEKNRNILKAWGQVGLGIIGLALFFWLCFLAVEYFSRV
jgi:hypothetical protein